MDKIFYNQASAKQLGWEPMWFGCKDFNNELIKKIKEFQSQYPDLKCDGLCGPTTYRRLLTDREYKISLLHSKNKNLENYIICNNEKVPIFWNKVPSLNLPSLS